MVRGFHLTQTREEGKWRTNVDKRKGFRRLALAVGVPWLGFWSLVGWIGYSRANDPYADLFQRSFGEAQMWEALGYGLIWPLVVFATAGLAYWVYRGFKPKL